MRTSKQKQQEEERDARSFSGKFQGKNYMREREGCAFIFRKIPRKKSYEREREMQPLGLKMVMGLNAAIGGPSPWPWPWPSRIQRMESGRTLGIVAASSSSSSSSENAKASSSSSSFLSRSQTYALLKKQMAVAAKLEDYKQAARIRDSLKSFEAEEPVLRLRGLLKKAIEEERFEDAARYRNELKTVSPHALLKCSSDATTLGIRVQVRSIYIEGRSLPSKGQYFFAYRIRITNNSQRPVQLLRRHWIITDANGKTENIWGVGVIGEQPVILPKTGFEYSSACPLSTPNGIMEGDFEMKHIDKVGSSTFNIAIAPFSLSIMGDDDTGSLL